MCEVEKSQRPFKWAGPTGLDMAPSYGDHRLFRYDSIGGGTWPLPVGSPARRGRDVFSLRVADLRRDVEAWTFLTRSAMTVTSTKPENGSSMLPLLSRDRRLTSTKTVLPLIRGVSTSIF